MTATSPNIELEKQKLRKRAKATRADAWQRHGAAAAKAICAYGLEFLSLKHTKTISGFRAFREEIDPEPLLIRLHGEGHALALPVIEDKGLPLIFRAWQPGDPLNAGPWGIEQPLEQAKVTAPDIVLVPLLAFDQQGYRIGYGGGFYDRSLAKLRSSKQIISIGLAFDEQLIDAVPHLDYDERLDWMLTPSGPLRCAQ